MEAYARAMSSAAARKQRCATVADLLAIPEHERFHEIIDGELVQKAMPSIKHGRTQFELSGLLRDPYSRRPGRGGPGGWIFANEVEVLFHETQVLRPDVVGWRRERLPKLPDEAPVAVRPDWVCEILSPSNAYNDTLRKLLIYQRAEVPHYWIIDPLEEVLIVYRWTPEGYLLVVATAGTERVRAEPFPEVELSVHSLVAVEDDDEG
jgi:Uma2 family endonuclease